MRSRFSALMAASAAAMLFMTASTSPVHADSILTFGLNNSGAITATATGGTSTTVTTTGGAQAATITLLNGVGVSDSAFLNLSATSVGAAAVSFGQLNQLFDGSFTITANADGSGTNYLSGSFTHLAFDSLLTGINGGAEASLKASDPTATITFTSDVITALFPPSAATFAFANVTPALHLDGATTGSFVASGAGTFSASATPEPSTMAIAGLGALGMLFYARKRRSR